MRLLAAGMVCLGLALPAFGGDWGVRLRRITAVAACAASAWDAASTHAAVRGGAREANPLLANRNGMPRWGRIIGFKAGICAGSIVAQELTGKRHSSMWTGLNVGLTGVYAGVAVHNRGIAARQAEASLAPLRDRANYMPPNK